MASRGYGITQQDMEASRLVFVSVKDARPKRKVAVPIQEGDTWQHFLQQVQTKLRLAGVQAIYQVSSGERVHGLEELQDIDELQVVEAKAPLFGQANGGTIEVRTGNGAGPSSSVATTSNGDAREHTSINIGGGASKLLQDGHPVASADIDARPSAAHGGGPGGVEDDETALKYVKRTSSLQRTLQSTFPSLFTPTLPVTQRDVLESAPSAGAGGMGRRRRSRAPPRGGFSMRNALAILAVVSGMGTIVYVYLRMMLPSINALQ